MSKIIMSGGGKGGVGKSAITLGVVDTLLEAGKQVVLVETDNSNPDAYKSLNELVTAEICNMDTEKGYFYFGEIIAQYPDAYIVVNTAARNKEQLEKFGKYLTDAATEAKRELLMLWTINRQRDVLELLDNFMDMEHPFTATYVVKNLYWGTDDDFVLYNESNVKKRVNATISYPSLHDVVADKLNRKRLALSNAGAELHTMERSALYRYRTAVHAAFKVLV